MSSNAVVTTPGASPLSSMSKLGPCVYMYRPITSSPAPLTSDTTSSEKPTPKLIVLATWMGARDAHIAKYLLQYQALYPTAPILLLRSEPRHFIAPGGIPADYAPAVPVVCSVFPELEAASSVADSSKQPTTPAKQQPQLLIHAWSNGGSASLHHLRCALALSANTTPSQIPLPPYTLVLDSTPGTFRYRAGYLAFATGLTGIVSWLAAPPMHALCTWYWVQHVLVGRGRTGPLAEAAAALNDDVSRASEVRRAYVYGEADALVHWRDVEAHAAEAEGKGFRVRSERFEGGQHVAHVRVDAERYWRVARETWEGVEGKRDA